VQQLVKETLGDGDFSEAVEPKALDDPWTTNS